MPDKKLLESLPFRAIVAYAVRCARLARQVYPDKPQWPHASSSQILDHCLNLAASFCSNKIVLAQGSKPAELAVNAGNIALAAATETKGHAPLKADRITAAAFAAHAAASAYTAALARDYGTAAGFASTAETASAKALKAVGNDSFWRFAEENFKKLQSIASHASDWTIDPSENGPLGPLECPADAFPSQLSAGSQEEFTLWIDPGSASVDELTELFSAMSDLCRALGGNGLTFAPSESERPLVVDHSS